MHLKALTSLRFFAALMVFFSHLGFLAKSESTTARSIFSNILSEGYIGVTFFFILSGFILSYSYSEKITSNKVNYLDFALSRIARIFPLHLLMLLFAIPLAAFAVLKGSSATLFLRDLFLNSFLIQSYFPYKEIYFSLNSPSWSLSVEIFFYLTFPFLLFFSSRSLALMVSSILIAKYYFASGLPDDAVHFITYIFPLSRLADFLAGILLFRAYKNIKQITSHQATIVQFLSIALLITSFYFSSYVTQAYRFDAYYLIPMSFLIIAFSFQNGFFAQAISTKVLVFLGEASFAFYLIHHLVIRYGETFRIKVFGLTGASNEVYFSLGYLTTSILLGAIIFALFEIKAKVWTLNLLRNIRAYHLEKYSQNQQ